MAHTPHKFFRNEEQGDVDQKKAAGGTYAKNTPYIHSQRNYFFSSGIRAPALCRVLHPSVLLEAPCGRRGEEEGKGMDELICL